MKRQGEDWYTGHPYGRKFALILLKDVQGGPCAVHVAQWEPLSQNWITAEDNIYEEEDCWWAPIPDHEQLDERIYETDPKGLLEKYNK